MTTAHEYAAGIIVLNKDSEGTIRTILVKHADGRYGFPKGHIEQGESAEVAARRELLEETGLIAEELLPQILTETYDFNRNGISTTKHNEYFITVVTDRAPVKPLAEYAIEVLSAEWMSLEEANMVFLYGESKRLLEPAINNAQGVL